MKSLEERRNEYLRKVAEETGRLLPYSELPDELKDEETMETKRYYRTPKRTEW